jgi:hypothetical protein
MMMFPALAQAMQAQQMPKQPGSSLGHVTQTPMAASVTPPAPSQLGQTTQGPVFSTNINSAPQQGMVTPAPSMFKQPGSSLGGPGGYSAPQGLATQYNQPDHSGFGGLRRAMMDRYRPREQMMRRGGR